MRSQNTALIKLTILIKLTVLVKLTILSSDGISAVCLEICMLSVAIVASML